MNQVSLPSKMTIKGFTSHNGINITIFLLSHVQVPNPNRWFYLENMGEKNGKKNDRRWNNKKKSQLFVLLNNNCSID